MNIQALLEDIRQLRVIEDRTVKEICKKLKQILIEESNLHNVKAPVTVCGDIHGQFYDFMKIFKQAGDLPSTSYIFIGDFVDRGYNSVETLMMLFLLKIKYPDRLTLLRGNHQSRQVSTMYGFYDQILKKYGNSNVWRYCNNVFDYLPLAALVEGKILCVHGGMSPDIRALDQIREINRNTEIPDHGPFCDLMWSDPEEIDTWAQNQRGAGWLFGQCVVNDFCEFNGLQLIARAHQLVQKGYQHWFTKQNLVTIWSAPNYCYRSNNLASFMKVDEHLSRTFTTFKEDQRSQESKHYKTLMPYFL